MAKIDLEYNNIISEILSKGRWYNDSKRTKQGVKRLQIPYYNFEHDLTEGFPLITTKKIYWKGVVGETLWFLSGSTDIRDLWKRKAFFWDLDWKRYHKYSETYSKYLKETESELNNKLNLQYNLGKIYGYQLRNFGGSFDQLEYIVNNLKEEPLSTRHRVSYVNPLDTEYQALPPCHSGWQILSYPLTTEERKEAMGINPFFDPFDYEMDEAGVPEYGFDLVWKQESVDTFLGLGFNIASYALIAHIIGKMVNMVPMKLRGSLRNVHLYDNSIEAAKETLKRKEYRKEPCWLNLNKVSKTLTDNTLSLNEKILNLYVEDFGIQGYESYPNNFNVKMLTRDE